MPFTIPSDAAQHIIGYADPLVVSPGGRLGVYVSCHAPTYSSRLLRLGPGHLQDNAPPVNHRPVISIPPAEHPGRPQFSRPGSFAIVPWYAKDVNQDHTTLTVSFWAQAFLPRDAGHDQYLFSNLEPSGQAGFASYIDQNGKLTTIVGSGGAGCQIAHLDIELVRHTWYRLIFTFSTTTHIVSVSVKSKGRPIVASQIQKDATSFAHVLALASSEPLTIASHSARERVSATPIASTTFNGKIDTFKIEMIRNAASAQTILQLDFSRRIPTDHVVDISEHALQGSLINSPARAVTGHDWDASETAWIRADYGYGAIHFHDDDVDDAAWVMDFELDVPHNLESGCYGVVINDGNSEDTVPFFVRPNLDVPSTNKVVLIYRPSPMLHMRTIALHRSRHTYILEARPDLGISLYDSHNDGSGTTHSSTKRVVLNMRPDYFHWGFGGPRELPADLWFVGFLDKELGPGNYDIVTDHDLSHYGTSLLLRYQVALSGSHPEYPTYAMLDSYDAFLASGRFFMYLGGNGYYWVTGHAAEAQRTHRIEVRRADQGCRVFSLPPGYWFLALTGEQGGLWRSRGRTPNRICGLGCDACGMGEGSPYGIVPGARQNPKLAFLFKGHGLETSDIIGDFGLVQGAASGDEIDRLDYSLGTPENAIMVATSKLAGGHSDNYSLFNEEIMFPMVNTLGTTSDKVRSDLVYFETASGGAVFGVGSINWVGSLAWKNYENNVAQITANALHEFIRRSERLPET